MQTQKLIKKINSSYKQFLEGYILGEKFSFIFSLPKISSKGNENLINSFQSELKKISEINEGFILNIKKTIKGTVIESIGFKDEYSYLKFINKNKYFKDFESNIFLIKEKLPLINDWIIDNVFKINEYNNDWNNIIEVIKYFILNSKKDLYIRELPIKIHTKFIENNKKIIDDLLEFIEQKENLGIINRINMSIEGFNSLQSFEQKYSLKVKPHFIRFRYLDKSLQKEFLGVKIDDINLKIEDFKYIKIDCEKVFIVENEINYLTFPEIKNSIIIWGKGFNISNIKNIEWLNKKEIYYWGDLDSHGFKILSQCRKYFNQTKSILMDKKVYNEFKKFKIKGKTLTKKEQNNLVNILNKEEFELFKYLNENKLRLEQENISQYYISREKTF